MEMSASPPPRPDAAQSLPGLPYAASALEPHIDTRTLQVHHDRHHAGYVKNLNDALAPHPALHGRDALWLVLNPGAVPEPIRKAVHDNAGGHVNHGLFWKAMQPAAGQEPEGTLADALRRDFGSVEIFMQRFAHAGTTVFGSGWVWLTRTPSAGGALRIMTTAGHDHPLMVGQYPILLNDVWEHAYYLKHTHRRQAYLDAWWPVVNWDEARRRYDNLETTDSAAERAWETEGGLAEPAAA